MKFFASTIKITVGELEFKEFKVRQASSIDEADDDMKAYCRDYYDGDDCEELEDGFSFFLGNVIVRSSYPCEITKEEWQRIMFNKALM